MFWQLLRNENEKISTPRVVSLTYIHDSTNMRPSSKKERKNFDWFGENPTFKVFFPLGFCILWIVTLNSCKVISWGAVETLNNKVDFCKAESFSGSSSIASKWDLIKKNSLKASTRTPQLKKLKLIFFFKVLSLKAIKKGNCFEAETINFFCFNRISNTIWSNVDRKHFFDALSEIASFEDKFGEDQIHAKHNNLLWQNYSPNQGKITQKKFKGITTIVTCSTDNYIMHNVVQHTINCE